MHLSKTRARLGLLASATALIAFGASASGASAATFEGGDMKFNFKSATNSKAKPKFGTKGSTAKTSTSATFEIGTATSTMTAAPSGNFPLAGTTTAMTFKVGKKTATLTKIVNKLAAGKGTLSVSLGGKTINLATEASRGRFKTASDFTELTLSSSKLTLTKAGAAALNKALGLKKPARGKPDKRFKAGQVVGTKSLRAERSLNVVGGNSRVVYDKPFVDQLRSCNIELSAVAPATTIPKDASAPEGGADLPIDPANGGTLNATSFSGQVNNQGGTRLDRPAPGQSGNTTGKAEYHSPLTNFIFSFGPQPPFILTAFIVNINAASPIGEVTGQLVPTLTDTAGTVTLNGELVLSATASGTLSQKDPPLGADCAIPAGSKIGAVQMVANVS